MKKVFALSPQELHDIIQNTVRVFNEYSLSKKIGPENTFRVNAGTHFFLYQIFKTPDGTELKVKCGKLGGGNMAEGVALSYINQFFSRTDQVAKGQIVLTPDVVNRDVYKSGRVAIGMFSLVKLIVAIVAILMALVALSH